MGYEFRGELQPFTLTRNLTLTLTAPPPTS